MPTPILAALLILGVPAFAQVEDRVAEPIQQPATPNPPPQAVPVPQQRPLIMRKSRNNSTGNDNTMMKLLQAWLGQPLKEDKDEEALRGRYNSGQLKEEGTDKYTPVTGSTPLSQAAKECGEAKQKECSPANFGGRTMCGLAVAKMLKCMAPVVNGDRDKCNGGCGHGKNFVNCSNGQMGTCGYTKLDPSDPKCKQAGAVLSYAQSPTERGREFGHVEFVCGDNRFCSVYSQPHDKPWPRYPADACWYPKSQVAGGGT